VEALSQSANTLGCASGSWRIWSLSDGYVDLPAGSLRYPNNKVCGQTEPPQRDASLVRLSVNCFLFDCSGMDRVLIDCGAGGSWDPSMGHLEEAMAEAGIDTSSVTMIALTHAHGDHINGLLMPDGRRAFNGLRKIVIGEDAVEEFLAEPVLEEFRCSGPAPGRSKCTYVASRRSPRSTRHRQSGRRRARIWYSIAINPRIEPSAIDPKHRPAADTAARSRSACSRWLSLDFL
jgi:hypothetical protein